MAFVSWRRKIFWWNEFPGFQHFIVYCFHMKVLSCFESQSVLYLSLSCKSSPEMFHRGGLNSGDRVVFLWDCTALSSQQPNSLTLSSSFQALSSSCLNSFFSCWMRHWIKFCKYKLKGISAYWEDLYLVKQHDGWSQMSVQGWLQPNWLCPYFKIFSHFTDRFHTNA